MVLIVGMCGQRAQIQTPLPLSDYLPLLFSRALIHNGLKSPATVVNERSHCLGSVKTRGPHYVSPFLEDPDTYECWNGVCGSTRFPTET